MTRAKSSASARFEVPEVARISRNRARSYQSRVRTASVEKDLRASSLARMPGSGTSSQWPAELSAGGGSKSASCCACFQSSASCTAPIILTLVRFAFLSAALFLSTVRRSVPPSSARCANARTVRLRVICHCASFFSHTLASPSSGVTVCAISAGHANGDPSPRAPSTARHTVNASAGSAGSRSALSARSRFSLTGRGSSLTY
mmetsp:Transcript_31175/g.72542  ORF Transcript_31175/g.72542 Transcript_31175/m.72542 type:complete len:203 (+) Transcript_31175:2549-3157(+)